ncbi:lipopolysaccharide kinase InaA family protein [Billgrantia sp. C5P2]|uniref:lipopolysaccharide kinase InaA family protein n=1 Tax=Billgrantia sp. C5P2 TaxID=3436239 RepID=UPI003DA3398B
MKITAVEIAGHRRNYLLFESGNMQAPLSLAKDDRSRLMEEKASSEFYFDKATGVLAKVKRDKYGWRQRPLRWFMRDFLDKRFFFQFEARKEVRSKKILRQAGLCTPRCLAWGISLNPFNHQGSLLLIEHVNGVMTGEQYFEGLNEPGRDRFLVRLGDDLLKLAVAGYVHRDLHMNNFLCASTGEIIWIDTHVKPLPISQRGKWRALYRSISQQHLLDERYRESLHLYLKERWRSA